MLSDKETELRLREYELSLRCETCGTQPACVCSMQSVEAMIFKYWITDCSVRSAAIVVYAEYTKTTALYGWWSLYGVFRTPFVVFENTMNLFACFERLRELSEASDSEDSKPDGKPNP